MQTTSRATFALATTALVTAALAPGDARAQDATATIEISAFVETACALTTDPIPINFGTYDDTVMTATSSFGIDCGPGTNVEFTITGDTPDTNGNRLLPNTDDPSFNLTYVINDPGGNPWINPYGLVANGGTQTIAFGAVLYDNQLDTARAGSYAQNLSLNMYIN